MFMPSLRSLAHSLPIKPIYCVVNNLFHGLMDLIWIAPSFSHRPPSMHLHSSHWPFRYTYIFYIEPRLVREKNTHDAIVICIHIHCKGKLIFMWLWNNYTFFLLPHFTHIHVFVLALFFQRMGFTFLQTSPLLSPTFVDILSRTWDFATLEVAQ
jgi:hypothetical protein